MKGIKLLQAFKKQTNFSIFLKKMQQLNTKKHWKTKGYEKSIGMKWLSERFIAFSGSYFYEGPLQDVWCHLLKISTLFGCGDILNEECGMDIDISLLERQNSRSTLPWRIFTCISEDCEERHLLMRFKAPGLCPVRHCWCLRPLSTELPWEMALFFSQ